MTLRGRVRLGQDETLSGAMMMLGRWIPGEPVEVVLLSVEIE